MQKILVTGSTGQIGTELVPALQEKYKPENLIVTFHQKKPDEQFLNGSTGEPLDATDKKAIEDLINKYQINVIYHLTSILSAKAEKNPDLAWRTNLESLKNILDLGLEYKLNRIFWPSSMAVFGPTTPRDNTPQETIIEPTMIYGVTKRAGELLCNYYFLKYGLDVRSLRYPGIISWKTPPGGGTTDYACEIFYKAILQGKYSCFLKKDTMLPMMYMDDAIKATLGIMEAKPEQIKIRTSYNLAAISFTPEELAREIKKYFSNFECEYQPDERQSIADSWPRSIDDSKARQDWDWKHEYNLPKMVEVMLRELRKKLGKQ